MSDKTLREHLLVVAKATYDFHTDGTPPTLSKTHQALAYTDNFVGEPGLSAPIYEADWALRKSKCDVILDATAHSPNGRPTETLDVGVQVGHWQKTFRVVGDRVWKKGIYGVSASNAAPFVSMPLHYGRAFGGIVEKHRSDGEPIQDIYLANPVGTGYSSDTRANAVEGMPLPNTEALHQPITSPSKALQPQSFGPVGRHWDPRRAYAGTYDTLWRNERFPFLPNDFDEVFYQSAPSDQQIDIPQGGEEVALLNLTPGAPTVSFKLPQPKLMLKALMANHRVEELLPIVDTLFIEPSHRRFTMVYRASLPLGRRSIFGVRLLGVGPVCKKWWASRVFGSNDCGCGGDDSKDPAAPDEHGDDPNEHAPADSEAGDT